MRIAGNLVSGQSDKSEGASWHRALERGSDAHTEAEFVMLLE